MGLPPHFLFIFIRGSSPHHAVKGTLPSVGFPEWVRTWAGLQGGVVFGQKGKGGGGALRTAKGMRCSSPLKLKRHLFRQVCRGRIYASCAVYPLYRIIGTAAAGGIYAAPTSQPIIFILVYGRGRGMPRPYTCNRGKTHPHPPPLRISLSTSPLPVLHDTTKKEPVTFCMSQTRGARYRTRTCDLLHVKQMLYQLS